MLQHASRTAEAAEVSISIEDVLGPHYALLMREKYAVYLLESTSNW